MEKKWRITEIKTIQNAPKYLDKVIDLIIEENSDLNKQIFEVDMNNEKKIIDGVTALAESLRNFEEILRDLNKKAD